MTDAATTVLVHSPLTTSAVWGGLPDVLRGRGHDVAVVDVRDDDSPPYAAGFVARAALQVRAAAADGPVLLVAHSGAGYLLPLLGSARRAARARVVGYLFLDAGLPPARPASRLDLLRAELSDAGGRRVRRRCWPRAARSRTGPTTTCASSSPRTGREPPWSARCAPAARASSPSRSPSRRTGRTRPAGCSACRTSYDGAARLAGLRGWPVLLGPDDRPGGHFAMLVDPESVADDLETLVSRL